MSRALRNGLIFGALWDGFATHAVVTLGVSWTLIPMSAAFNFLIWWSKTPRADEVAGTSVERRQEQV